ncbi:myosin, light chain 2, 20 kDa [Corchorus olitorius]|uniref:Myosin, light chain 2, 20 kDa n=1 Tax=Corchorus olitorius TaxID=93759 RepID=A0A1R3G582_9ROSI|nr:myosin, light chain 2, 20 kDa [Corchorus olitorius]
MDEFEARFESLRAQFKDYGSLYDENFEGRFTREDCREVLAMVDNLPADDVASKPGFKAPYISKPFPPFHELIFILDKKLPLPSTRNPRSGFLAAGSLLEFKKPKYPPFFY